MPKFCVSFWVSVTLPVEEYREGIDIPMTLSFPNASTAIVATIAGINTTGKAPDYHFFEAVLVDIIPCSQHQRLINFRRRFQSCDMSKFNGWFLIMIRCLRYDCV